MILVEAIDRTVAYVRSLRANKKGMTRAEVDEFRRLAQAVYALAYPMGLAGAFPQMAELRPQLEYKSQRQSVSFEGALHLPGDWGWHPSDVPGEPPISVFVPSPYPRWYEAMDDLRAVALKVTAEANGDQRPAANPCTTREPTEPKPSVDAQALAVFIEHPDWTKKRIAAHLKPPRNAKSLCPARCPKLTAAIAAHRAKIDPGTTLRGSKGNDGNMEAWEDG